MDMKIKKTITILAFCMLVFVSFSAVMVYAPPPSDGVTPFQNVIVTNTDPIPVEVTNNVDVSGWLHTTKSGHEHAVFEMGNDFWDFVPIETAGYRLITLKIDVPGQYLIGLSWYADGELVYSEGITVGLGDYPVYRKYDVMGEVLDIFIKGAEYTEGDLVYYLTT